MSAGVVRELVRAELESQAASGWDRLAKVPCTRTWRAIAHIRKLSPSRRDALFEAIASNAPVIFEPPLDRSLQLPAAQDPEYTKLVDALAGDTDWSWDYASARTLRSILRAIRSKDPRMAARAKATPPAVVRRAEQITSVTAAMARKVVGASVAARFGAKPHNAGGGEWEYRGRAGSTDFLLTVDYGGWDQLRYDVSYDHPTTGLRARRVNYERLLGCGGTGWDYLTEENLEQAIALMCDLVEWLVRCGDRASSLGGPTSR